MDLGRDRQRLFEKAEQRVRKLTRRTCKLCLPWMPSGLIPSVGQLDFCDWWNKGNS